jgi:hypothetical protein
MYCPSASSRKTTDHQYSIITAHYDSTQEEEEMALCHTFLDVNGGDNTILKRQD